MTTFALSRLYPLISRRVFSPFTSTCLVTPNVSGNTRPTRLLCSMTSADITDPSDIPTLADLYTSRVLSAYEDAEAEHDDELNKRVSIWRGQHHFWSGMRSVLVS